MVTCKKILELPGLIETNDLNRKNNNIYGIKIKTNDRHTQYL